MFTLDYRIYQSVRCICPQGVQVTPVVFHCQMWEVYIYIYICVSLARSICCFVVCGIHARNSSWRLYCNLCSTRENVQTETCTHYHDYQTCLLSLSHLYKTYHNRRYLTVFTSMFGDICEANYVNVYRELVLFYSCVYVY